MTAAADDNMNFYLQFLLLSFPSDFFDAGCCSWGKRGINVVYRGDNFWTCRGVTTIDSSRSIGNIYRGDP